MRIERRRRGKYTSTDRLKGYHSIMLSFGHRFNITNKEELLCSMTASLIVHSICPKSGAELCLSLIFSGHYAFLLELQRDSTLPNWTASLISSNRFCFYGLLKRHRCCFLSVLVRFCRILDHFLRLCIVDSQLQSRLTTPRKFLCTKMSGLRS